MEDELKVTEALLKERQRVLDAIPECKSHGSNCVPHALKWIKEIQDQNAKLLEALKESQYVFRFVDANLMGEVEFFKVSETEEKINTLIQQSETKTNDNE